MDALETLKTTAKRSRAGVVAGRIAVERTRRLRRLPGRRDGPMGATHRRFDRTGSVGYVNAVYRDYLRYGAIPERELAGLTVLELGPGDNFGVALRFLAAGVSDYVATDRFLPFRDQDHNELVYRDLLDGLDAEARERLEPAFAGAAVELGRLPFTALEEVPIEDCPRLLDGRHFDLVVSRAVLEHVHDLDRAFASMDELLRPGGRMLHKVDLRDHDLFTAGGHNALTFLTVPDRVYRWMGEETAGLPNRTLLDWYRGKFEQLGYEVELLVTHEAGVEPELEPHVPLAEWTPSPESLREVAAMRSKLPSRYAGLEPEELAIAGFFVVATKPPAGAGVQTEPASPARD